MIVPDATNDSELVSANNGVLLLQIADTTPFGVRFPVNQVTLAPKDVNETDTSKFPRISAADVVGDSSSVFFAVLPANDYVLSSLRSYHAVGEGYFSHFYPAGIELGTFSIEPGKVTDLGVLAVYVRRSGDDYGFSTVRTTTGSRAPAEFTAAIPGLAARTENMHTPLGWHPDGNDADRHNDYINAVNRQIVFADPYVDEAAGIVRFPSRLGVIVQRNAEREWSLDAIPSDAELRLSAEIGAQQIVITEFDELYRRSATDSEWRRVASPPGAGKLMFVGEHPDASVYAARQTADSVSIWAAPSLEEAWDQIGAITPELNFFEQLDQNLLAINHDIKAAAYAAHGPYLYLALRKDLYRFDLRTREFQELKVPAAASVQVRNGYITVVSATSTVANRVTFDAGNSWKRFSGKFDDQREGDAGRRSGPRYRRELFPPKFLGHPIFLDENRAFAIHEAKKPDGKPFLITTNDGSAIWRAAGSAALPDGCGRLVLANADELLLGCFLSGEFYRSNDAGESWVLDRAPSEI